MNAKDKRKKSIKITLKNSLCFLAFIISLLYVVIFYDRYFVKNNVFARETNSDTSEVKISKASQVDIDDLLDIKEDNENKEEYSVEEVDLEYITKYRNNPKLPKNTIQVVH